MQFLYPGFLWALLALIIPIIIHLFYFRRFKKVYFTNVKFLKEVKEETSARNRLKDLLILLSRLLALAFLVFAFAQPIISKNNKAKIGNRIVSIFVDNSFSMNALSEDVELLTKAKDKAADIVKTFSDDDKYQLITHNLSAQSDRLISKQDALTAIEEIQSSSTVSQIENILRRVNSSAESSEDFQSIFLLSDFQKSISDFEIPTDTTVSCTLIPLQSVKENNISIDSVWFDAPTPVPNQENKMYAKVTNYSNETKEDVRLSINIKGQKRPLGTLNLGPNESKLDTFSLNALSPGQYNATVSVADFPIQFDNDYRISFEMDQEVNVLVIYESRPNTQLRAAFSGLNNFKVQEKSASSINYADFPATNLIVLNDLNNVSSGLANELNNYVDGGGNLLIFPGKNISISGYKSFLQRLSTNVIESKSEEQKQVGYLNTQEFIFDNVFEANKRNITLPSVNTSYKLSSYYNVGEEVLMKFRDDESFVSKYKKGSGNVFLCSAPLDKQSSNLSRNAEVFVPMLYKMAISTGKRNQIAHTIGKDQFLTITPQTSSNEQIYKLKAKEEFIPGQLRQGSKMILDLQDQIKEADFYSLTLEDEVIRNYAFNFDRRESDLSYYSIGELQKKYGESATVLSANETKDLSNYLSQNEKGIALWKWCIILVLLFLGLESLLLRYFKT